MPKKPVIPDEVVFNKAFLIRGQKVTLDMDLAELNDVPTKVLSEAVKRYAQRFPDDFMFQVSAEEFQNLKSQIVTSNWGGRRTSPNAFTEPGVAIIRKGILLKREQSEKKVLVHDDDIVMNFGYLKELLDPKAHPVRKIGPGIRKRIKIV